MSPSVPSARRCNRSLHFRPSRIRTLEFQVNAIGRKDAEVVVCVVDSGDHCSSAEVDLFRVRPSQKNIEDTSEPQDRHETAENPVNLSSDAVAEEEFTGLGRRQMRFPARFD